MKGKQNKTEKEDMEIKDTNKSNQISRNTVKQKTLKQSQQQASKATGPIRTIEEMENYISMTKERK